VVQLFAAGNQLLQTNTAILPKFNADVTGTQFSSPFDVSGTFNYPLDGYWTNVREAQYGQSVPATKVVATVTLANGKVVTAENDILTGDPTSVYPASASVTTNPATLVTSNDATLNGTNGPTGAIGHSFWVSTSTFSTASQTIPSGVYSTPDLGAIAANTAFSALLSSLTTAGVPGNLPAITPNTTYYYVAWADIGGTWYAGAQQSFSTTNGSAPATPGVTTNNATGVTMSDATLNGTNGPVGATQESFWVSLAPFSTASPNIPAGVYSTPVLPPVAANGTFSDPLSLVTTNGIMTGGVPGNLSAITPNTTYYFAAWSNVNGTWYPGAVLNFTTTNTGTTGLGSISGETYNDLNKNQTLDSGEPGIAGFTINLYQGAGWWGTAHNNPVFMSAVTDANGNYSFSGLADGTYSVEEINMPAWHQDTSDYNSIVVSNGAAVANTDFANTPKKAGEKEKDHGYNGNGYNNHQITTPPVVTPPKNQSGGNDHGNQGNPGNGNGHNGSNNSGNTNFSFGFSQSGQSGHQFGRNK
jgi:hypothetical protein